jgi:quinol monooxygenase YgiN
VLRTGTVSSDTAGGRWHSCSVLTGENLHVVSRRVLEIEAASVSIDDTLLHVPGVRPVGHIPLSHACKNGVELVLCDQEGVVTGLGWADTVRVVQADTVGRFHTHERPKASRWTEAKNVSEEPRRLLLVEGRHDRVVQMDRHACSTSLLVAMSPVCDVPDGIAIDVVEDDRRGIRDVPDAVHTEKSPPGTNEPGDVRIVGVIAYTEDMSQVIVQGVFSIDPDERDRFIEMSVTAMRSSRQEAGCLEYVIAADPLEPERAVLSERWESMDHLQQHLAQQKNPGRGADATRPVPRHAEITLFEVATSRPLR